MAMGENALLPLLFEEGRTLENIKFFPGPKCDSPEDLFRAAASMIREVVSGKSLPAIPGDGIAQEAIGDLVKRFQ